jgi:peptide/nickel transport system substrate-binding protein
MNRSGIVLFFLFLFLAVIVLFQVLGMMQSDRLYERVNRLESVVKSARLSQPQTAAESNTASQNSHPGDEGDWLVWCLGAEPATLNPISTSADKFTDWVSTGTIFESLLEYDPNVMVLRPLLAESYSVSDDGMEITFRLKDTVHFSDGVPITADDIIFTFKTIKNPLIDASNLANYYRDINDVTKINDREVKFTMSRVYYKSLETTGLMPILPQHSYAFKDAAEFNKRISNPMGSGPYAFERWTVGREIILNRNENYWGRKPNLKKFVYRIILNDTAAIQSLRANEIDYLRPLPDQFTALANDESFARKFYCLSYSTPADGYFFIGWNETTPFFKDKRVRLAMTCLIDRDAICKHLLRNPAAKVQNGPFYMNGPQSDPNIKPWPYDPQKARQLLAEAGWKDTDGDGILDKNGIPFRFKYMIVSGVYLHEQISKLIKDELAKVGIDVTPDPYEWSIFDQRIKTHQFDAVSLAWGGTVEEDPYQIWHSSQMANRGSNFISFNNPEADKLIEEARRTLDRSKRNNLYRRFHQIIHEEQPYTFVYTRPEQRFLDRRFHNVKIHKLGIDEREWYVPNDLQRYK